VKDDDAALRATRTQAAVLRALAGEVERRAKRDLDTGAVRAQAVEESERLVNAMGDLSRARSPAPKAPRRAAPHDAADTANPWPRILVVEDDDEVRRAITQGLGPEYEVVAVNNGVEGLRAALEQHFDAIVVDMWMPEMDGATMVKCIRNMPAHAAVPVIFLSAETAPEHVAAGFSAGATTYLLKPLDLELLDQELRSTLRK
jgi:CheY-like chemotaxis protein